MARTKQTARKSVGGKSVRGKGGKGLGKGSGAPSPSSPAPQPMASFTNKRKRGYAPGAQAALLAEDDQPQFTSPPEITFTGTHDTAFYAHYFTTGEREKDQEVRCHYAVAHTRDPLTQTEDCWMSVSYNSKYDGVGMKLNAPDGRHSNRPALNLVVALDISGSMGDSFHGDEENDEDEGAVPKKKLQVAKECLLALIGQLQDDDAFGLVIFNSKASVLQPLAKWSSVDKIALEKAINKLRANGGTDLTVAFKAATKLYAQAEEGPHRSNRVFFLTDMEAGSGEDERTFIETVKRNSEVSLWSTIVGIGMDLARETVEETSKTPGCNYATVVSSQDFREMINHEFDYTVTPIGFNVSLGLESDVWQLHSGYGSPEVSCLQPGGQVRHSTLFPSTQNAEGESRSGLFLFKIDRKEAVTDRGLDSSFSVVSKWDNLMGLEQTDVQQLQFKEGHVDNLGIRKAVLLVYYTDFIRPYLAVRNQALGLPSAASPVAAPMPTRYLPLITPENRFSLLTQFIDFFKREMEAVRDSSLSDELSFLETVYDVEHPLFSAPLTAAVEKKNEDDSLVESKGKHVDNDIADNDDEDYDEEDAVKRRKMEEDDEKLARQLAAMEEENQEELQQVVADSQQPMASDGDETTNNQCVVCWAEQKSVLFQPCRHMCTCKSCADKTPTCPLCRSDISQRTDVFV